MSDVQDAVIWLIYHLPNLLWSSVRVKRPSDQATLSSTPSTVHNHLHDLEAVSICTAFLINSYFTAHTYTHFKYERAL